MWLCVYMYIVTYKIMHWDSLFVTPSLILPKKVVQYLYANSTTPTSKQNYARKDIIFPHVIHIPHKTRSIFVFKLEQDKRVGGRGADARRACGRSSSGPTGDWLCVLSSNMAFHSVLSLWIPLLLYFIGGRGREISVLLSIASSVITVIHDVILFPIFF